MVATLLFLSLAGCRAPEKASTTQMTEPHTTAPTDRRHDDADAGSIHRRAIAIDMHADTVQFMIDDGADINQRLTTTHLDAVRMHEGGLDAQFFSIWVEPQFYGRVGQRAVERADQQIAAVRALAENHPETWTLATTAADIRRAARDGKLAALMGLEGGYAIDEKLENVERYYDMGVRYMSPAWTYSTSWAGSSGDAVGQTRGFNEFGRARHPRDESSRHHGRCVARLGQNFPGHRRNFDRARHRHALKRPRHRQRPAQPDDEQIRALARKGGVVCVVFYPAFVEPGWNEKKQRVDAEIAPLVEAASRAAQGGASLQRMARDRVREREYARRMPPVTVARIVDHIDHIVRLVGVDTVGIGSDFDGIQAVPADLADVAELPNLTAELLRRGYTAADIEKILGGNILRVMEQVASR